MRGCSSTASRLPTRTTPAVADMAIGRWTCPAYTLRPRLRCSTSSHCPTSLSTWFSPRFPTLLLCELPLQALRLSWRSEEHTSELQSRGHLVCRLLLENKHLTHG